MNDILEGGIMWYIYTKYLSKGYQFNDQMCRYIALAFWNKYPYHRQAATFKASNKWVRRFKKKYGLVNRRVHYHRRVSQSEETIRIAKLFHDEMVECYKKHERNGTKYLLINIDETSWKVGQFGDLTWASKGSDYVEFSSTFNEKECVTAIAAITASEQHFKLPLCILRAGSTDRAAKILSSLSQYVQIDVTEQGWSTTKSFATYLIWLRLELDERYKDMHAYTKDTEIDLVLDLHSSHRNYLIKELADKLKFKLHFIPASLTDKFQPLDRNIFGALKAMARAEWYRVYTLNPDKNFTIEDACAILLKCWAEISSETLKKAWLPYSHPDGDGIDSLTHTKTMEVAFESSILTISDEDIQGQMRALRLKLPTDTKKHESKRDMDEEEEENEIDYSLFKDIGGIPLSVESELRAIIDHEKYMQNLYGSNYFVKPIINPGYGCYVNATLQLIVTIPGIRQQLMSVENNPMLAEVYKAIQTYDEAREIVYRFEPKLYEYLFGDVSENVENILTELNEAYGLYIPDYCHRCIAIDLFPDADKSIDIIRSIEEAVKDNEFTINKVILFRKNRDIKFSFPETFKYNNFIFILKSALVNIDEHFYIYTRRHFSYKMLLINDTTIKSCDINAINHDGIYLAIYFVFDANDNASKTIPEEKVISTTEIEFPQDVVEVLEKIYEKDSKEAKRKSKFTGKIRTPTILYNPITLQDCLYSSLPHLSLKLGVAYID